MIRSKLLTALGGEYDAYIGEQEYLTAGEYEFTVPLAMRRLHICCVGAGGQWYGGTTLTGGGGGGLAWANDVEVEPGEKIKVAVGSFSLRAEDGRSGLYRLADPEDPDSDKEWIMYADGGDRYGRGGSPWWSDELNGNNKGGGTGGSGGSGRMYNSTNYFFGGGGGAAGYTGNGGNGWKPTAAGQQGGIPGQGSGGASGATEFYRTRGSMSGNAPGGVGGGVHVRGRGATAAPTISQGEADDAVNGNPGSDGRKAKFGGGCSGDSGSNGGNGAVRIIWGVQYSYPDNADVA